MTRHEQAIGVLLVRDGCYAVQAYLTYIPMPGARLRPIPLIQGEILNPLALLVDTVAFMGTGILPLGIAMFTIEKNHNTTEGKEA